MAVTPDIHVMRDRPEFAGGPIEADSAGSTQRYNIYGLDRSGYFVRRADCDDQLRAIVTMLNTDPNAIIEQIELIHKTRFIVNLTTIGANGHENQN